MLAEETEAQPGVVEEPAAEGLHRDDAHVRPLRERDQLFRRRAVHEVERNLDGVETAGPYHVRRDEKAVRAEGGESDLPCPDPFLHPLHGASRAHDDCHFLPGAHPVELEDVDAVRAQPPKALVEIGEEPLPVR